MFEKEYLADNMDKVLIPTPAGEFNLKSIVSQTDSNTEQLSNISINVKKFLCDDGQYVQGDGIHDDTTGIQKAVDSMKQSTNSLSIIRGGILYFPEGKYIISESIKINGGTTVQGQTRDSSIIYNKSTTKDSFFVEEIGFNNAYSISFKDIQLYGQRFATSGSGINIGYNFINTGAISVTFERVDIYGHFNGIAIGNSINVKFDNVLIQNSFNDGIITSGTSNIVTILNTYVSYCGRHGYHFNDCNYCSFLNTGSDSNGGDAYHFEKANRLSLISIGAECNIGHALFINEGTSITLTTPYFIPNSNDIFYLNNVDSMTVINGNGVSDGLGKYSFRLVGTTKQIVIIGGYFTSPGGLSNDFTKFTFINYGSGTGLSVGTFQENDLTKLHSPNQEILRLTRNNFRGYGFIIEDSQRLGIIDKITENIVCRIEANAPSASVTLRHNGMLDCLYGVVLWSPTNKRYRITVNDSGVLSTVLL